MRFVHLERIDVIQALDIVVDNSHVRLLRDLVCDDSNSYRVSLYVISKNFWFNVMQKSIQVSHMKKQTLYERIDVFPTHSDDHLFSGWTLCHHLDMRFRFGLTVDNAFNRIDFLSTERRECFFNFQNFWRVGGYFGSLGVRLVQVVRITVVFAVDWMFVG